MKNLAFTLIAALALSAGAEYSRIGLNDGMTVMPYDANVVALDVVSTSPSTSVTVSVVRVVQSFTNCVSVLTNVVHGIYVTNRWLGVKETKAYTNEVGAVTCTGGVGRVGIGRISFGGDAFVATGTSTTGETVKATLIIQR